MPFFKKILQKLFTAWIPRSFVRKCRTDFLRKSNDNPNM